MSGPPNDSTCISFNDDDLAAALRGMESFVDVTPEDLQEICRRARAAALIAVIGGPQIHALGFLYALAPAGLGALVLLAVAVALNNLARGRRYPEYWW